MTNQLAQQIAEYARGNPGVPYREIGARFGVSLSVAHKAAKEAGVTRPCGPRPMTYTPEMAEAARSYQSLGSIVQAAEIIGVDHKALRKHLRREGIPVRPAKGGRKSRPAQ